jgi:transposase
MQRGITANVLHRWRSLAREGKTQTPTRTGEFFTLPLPAATSEQASAHVRIELRRGLGTMSMTWPAGATSDRASWTRELLW